MRTLVIFIFTFTIVFSSENKVVKTSELELFLFKVGFESLLKDVELTKDKSTINEEQLKILDKKVEYIMNELKKDNIKIKEDTNVIYSDSKNVSKEEIKLLKQQIAKLQEQINNLQSNKSYPKQKKIISFKEGTYIVKAQFARIKSRPLRDSQNIRKVLKEKVLEIESCDTFQWCKLKNEEAYIAKYLLKPLSIQN